MVQFFSSSSQIITPTSRTSIQTIRRPRHSQEAQTLDQQIPQPTSFSQKHYLSSLVHSNSSNPRNLWKTVNNLLHRYCPFSLESPSTFSSCFSPIIQSFYVLITS